MGIMYEGQFVGIIGISFKIKYFIAQYNGGWWLHYLVDEQYSGRGIGTEAIRQMLEIVKTETSIDSIYAGCYSDNYASIHLLKKFGFHLVRSTRNNQIYELVIQRIF
jgi:RimJ/RimL family protein N-acetyltransferase